MFCAKLSLGAYLEKLSAKAWGMVTNRMKNRPKPAHRGAGHNQLTG